MDDQLAKVCREAAGMLGRPWLIQDVTTCVRQPTKRIDLAIVTHIVLHRIEVADNAIDIAQWFNDNPSWVGPYIPYKFIARRNGELQQALLMDRIGYHAAGINHRSIGIGIVGDFRALDDLGDEEIHPGITGVLPTPEQVAAVIAGCVRIRDFLRQDVLIVDHTSVAKDANKRCPGPLFPCEFVTQACASLGGLQWRQKKF